jgi:hypothetical protein
MVDINRPFFVASPDSAALLTTRENEVLEKFGSWVAFCVFCVCVFFLPTILSVTSSATLMTRRSKQFTLSHCHLDIMDKTRKS